MMIRDFEARDVFDLAVQDKQAVLISMVSPELARSLEHYESFTALHGNRILGCAGVVPVWPGRAMAWAYLASDLRQFMVPITRAVHRFLEVQTVKRIEATASWDDGCRWLEMLGFVLETPEMMQGYLPGGEGAYLYARVR